MNPESSSFIPPAPERPVTPQSAPTITEQIVVPAFNSEAALELTQGSDVAVAQLAEAAKRIISSVPGFEDQSASSTPSREVIEVPMPSDPSHVVGWEGITRRG